MKVRSLLLVGVLALVGSRASADLGFPASVKFPAQIQINPDQKLIKEDRGEAEIPVDKAGTRKTLRGAHYMRWLDYKPAAGEPANGFYNGTEGRIFAALQGAFTKAGWTPVWTNEEKTNFSLKLGPAGAESWLLVDVDGPQGYVKVEVIEPLGAQKGLTLPPPAAQPERFADASDIPYLPPPAGSTRKGQGRGDGPLDVTPPGTGEEARLVGTGTVTRTYSGPSTLSAIQFMEDYVAALTAAGWTVQYPPVGKAASDSQIIAHYTKSGRDIWARLYYEYGANLSFTIADAGAENWAARFAKDCKVPLYGVFFDFNKATLKPESESVLNRALGLLQGNTEKVEVRGHTDSVGGDAANLTLSEARAASVRTWLVGHGVDAARITSKGYGKTQPVADNATDAGRAKNRRVELAKATCATR